MRGVGLNMRNLLIGLVTALVFAATAATALADDWTVTRLRGTVQQLVGGQWQPLERGNVVPDERTIFTRADGHATLVRGNEAIELGPNTQIEIYDKGGRKPFTTILQHAGTLTVEAEVRNVQHFAVRTTYLAAVVKGTRFTVTARRSGGSVEVLRGQVSVEDEQNDATVLIVAGQKAKVAKGGSVTITGKPDPSAKAAAKNAKTMPPHGADPAAPGQLKKSSGEENNGNGVLQTVDKTDTVGKVVDNTTDTVGQVVDTTTDTVGTVAGVLGKTTRGLTGLLGG